MYNKGYYCKKMTNIAAFHENLKSIKDFRKPHGNCCETYYELHNLLTVMVLAIRLGVN